MIQPFAPPGHDPQLMNTSVEINLGVAATSNSEFSESASNQVDQPFEKRPGATGEHDSTQLASRLFEQIDEKQELLLQQYEEN